MEFSNWLLFSGIALIAVISPGPAVLLAVTNSLTRGMAKSVYSSLGNITGLFLVSGAAILGLGAVLQTSTVLFSTVKILGAIYLIYLGIRQFNSSDNVFKNPIQTATKIPWNRNTFLQGIIVAISNPKAILFFTALFPQFIDGSKSVPFQFLILTTTFMLYSFIALVIYSMGAQSAKGWFARGDRLRWFNRISGAFFIAFGLGLFRLRGKTT
jgi:threonine/homoserine/homoserine lactone efflux protein